VAVDGLDYADGTVSVPRGPGLGVELDPERFAAAVERHRVEGDLPSQGDPHRPDFVPARQVW
jgi:glucarate dehydratase